MNDDPPVQPALIPGFYRCDDCGALVDRLRRTRRFRLCDACYERVVPTLPPDGRIQDGSPEHEAIRRYWEWHAEINERVPRRRAPGHTARARQHTPSARPTDDYYPLCACGRRREVSEIGRAAAGGGLFGGPFHHECAFCEARRHVDLAVQFMAKIHPDWDDEDWLDHLYRVFPEAFSIGVLPDYWYELKARRLGAEWGQP